jgi:hypothetical protein
MVAPQGFVSLCYVVLRHVGIDVATEVTRLLTLTEAANLLRRKPQTLRKWHCQGKGLTKAVQIEGRWFYDPADIQEYIEKCRKDSSVRAS